MPCTSVELREQRAAIVKQARDIQALADREERELTSEEQESFDKHMTDVDGLKARIDRVEKLERAEEELDEPQERSGTPLDPARAEARRARGHDGADLKGDFRHFLRTGEVRKSLRADQSRMAEYRDTIIGTDSKGGFLIAPTQVTDQIVKQIDDMVFVRKLATVQRVTEAKALGIRKLATRMADANWTTEVGAVTEDTTQAFDRRDLTPNLLSKLALLSIRTLLLSADAEALVNTELSYKFGITEEKAYLTGTGSGQPLGVFVASASGISTARDVAAASATALAGDDFINAKYSLKQNYLADPKAGWIVHRAVVKAIRKLKISSAGTAGEFQYVWQPGLTEGAPDRILDVPYYMSEYAPSTIATGQYVAVLGNFRYYWIAEVIDLVIQRLVERYADTNQVGFIGRRWLDGAPILEEAFARLKMA